MINTPAHSDPDKYNEELIEELRPFRKGKYVCDVGFKFLGTWLNEISKDFGEKGQPGVNLDPDFQRGNVWNDEQRSCYVEYILRGGNSRLDLQWNHPHWDSETDTDLPIEMQIIDGKQRLEAVRRYLAGEIKAFGRDVSEFSGTSFDAGRFRFTMNVHDMATRKEVLQFYLDLNSGGVVHSENELSRVRKLLSAADNRLEPLSEAKGKRNGIQSAFRKF